LARLDAAKKARSKVQLLLFNHLVPAAAQGIEEHVIQPASLAAKLRSSISIHPSQVQNKHIDFQK